jgi:nucleoid-associated protein YgaU
MKEGDMLSFEIKQWGGRAAALAVALSAAAPPAPVLAAEGGAAPAAMAAAGSALAPPVAPPAGADPFSAAALAPERLDGMRGGADAVWNDMKLNGAVSGNTAVNVATGSNIITNGSFSSASGLPIAIQNSGANVLIQNATIINVRLQ